MGDTRLIIAIPTDWRGMWNSTHEYLANDAQSLGCTDLGTIDQRLGRLGVRGSDRELIRHTSYTFRLWQTGRSDLNRLIDEVETRHNDPTFSRPGTGFIKYAEVEPELSLNSEPELAIGKQFSTANSNYDSYRRTMLKVNLPGYDGRDVDIAVIDTGAEPNTPGVSTFTDVLGKSTSWVDDSGHGTAMVTLIHDLAPGAVIHVYRAVETRLAKLWDVMSAVAAAVAGVKPKIVNLSLGMPNINCTQCGASALTRTRVFRDFIDAMNLVQRNANDTEPIYVAAVGNQGKSDGFNIPATYKFTLAVGAIDSNYDRSSFSNYGTAPNETQKDNYVLLPGGNTDAHGNPVEYLGTGLDENNQTTYCIGTSPAAAMATGLVALYMEKRSYDGKDPLKLIEKVILNCNNNNINNYTREEHGQGMLFYQ